VGILSEHALKFARLTEKRLGPSEYSNSIFERFIGVFGLVFSANHFFKSIALLGRPERYENVPKLKKMNKNTTFA
jgi:hypothetical protein